MKTKPEGIILALSGILLILITTYIQTVSMDLSHHRVAENMVNDMKYWAWWTVVGLPFFAGIVYLGAAVFYIKVTLNNKSTLILFAGCLIVGCTLSAVGGLGYLAAIVSILNFVYVLLRSIKSQRAKKAT